MRFRFMSGQDVPEWILAEVSTLSRISCVRLKLITRQVINELAGGVLDVDKVAKLAPRDSGFSWSDIKATLAAIAFVLSAAVRNDVDAAVLNAELQQLGLPKENSDGVSRPYRIHRERLRAQAAADSLRAPRLVLLERRVDAVVATSALGNLRRHMSSGGIGGVGEEGVASTASAGGGGGAPIGEALVSLRLGLSRLPSSLPTRVPTGDVAATPLLLAAHAAAGAAAAAAAAGAGEGGARGGAGASAASAAALDASKGDAALLALGIKPIGTPAAGSHSGGVLGHADGTSSGGGGVGEGAGGGPRAGTPAAAYPRVRPAAFLDVTMDLSKAHALLAELRIAYSVLTKTCAALPPSSSVA